MIHGLALRLYLWLMRRQGLQIAADCRITGWPNFGSEPYLVSIGRRVTITGGVVFITHDGATWVFRGQPGTDRVIRYGRVDILDNCFVGYRAILLPGVTVGPNSIVAAGSVVTRDVAPGVVVAGSPAKVICSIEEYKQRCARESPNYDWASYRRDKRRLLSEMYPPPPRDDEE